MFLPEKEHNGWTLTESMSINNGKSPLIKLIYEDGNGKEIELVIKMGMRVYSLNQVERWK